MYTIPLRIDEHHYVLFVVLEDENLKRMSVNDPAIVYPSKLPSPFNRLALKEVIVCAPGAENVGEMVSLFRTGKRRAAVDLLMSGFEFRPKLGDSDMPYRAVKDDA